MDKLFPSFLVYQELNLVSIGLTRRRVDFYLVNSLVFDFYE